LIEKESSFGMSLDCILLQMPIYLYSKANSAHPESVTEWKKEGTIPFFRSFVLFLKKCFSNISDKMGIAIEVFRFRPRLF
jgi:hypothetical protein